MKYIDEHGLPDKAFDIDGGDSCNRVGLLISLENMMSVLDKLEVGKKFPDLKRLDPDALYKLQPHPGVLIRHTNLKWWASNWGVGSIDQLRPYLIACSFENITQLSRYFIGHLKRGLLFCDNFKRNGTTKGNHGQTIDGNYRDYSAKIPDPTGPEVWSIYVRGFDLWFLYPLLYILDLQILVSAIQNRFSSDHDILNNALSVLFARYKYWTLIAWLAHKIHPKEMVIKKVESYFSRPGDLDFFGDLFKRAYRNVDLL